MQVPLGCGLVPGPPPEPPLPIPRTAAWPPSLWASSRCCSRPERPSSWTELGAGCSWPCQVRPDARPVRMGDPGQAPTAGWRAFAKATMWWEEEDKCP